MNMNNARMTGAAVGVAVGLVICVLVFRWFNKDKSILTKYDEMQEKVRGKAYMYGFFAMLICEALLALLAMGDVKLPADGPLVHFSVIFIGVMVQASYSIWNNAYKGMNTNVNRFAVFCVIISLFNFVPAIVAIASGNMLVDGQLQFPFINLLCGMMFIIIGLEILIKRIVDKTAPDEEE